MELKARLQNELKDSMRANDDTRRRTIRMALSAIKLAEIEKMGELDDQVILTIVQKEIKSRREAEAEAARAMRPDLAAAAQEEIAVLEAFLPKQLSTEELQSMAAAAVAEAGAAVPADMGKVMKLLLPRVQGRAAGDQVSQAVRAILQKS